MDFLINSAHAAGGSGAAAGGNPLLSMLPLVVIFVIFWFLLIRPQQKRAKEHRKMVEALGVGDEIVTNGGLLGKVNKVGEQFLTVEIADGVEIRLQRHAVGQVLPKGTIKSV